MRVSTEQRLTVRPDKSGYPPKFERRGLTFVKILANKKRALYFGYDKSKDKAKGFYVLDERLTRVKVSSVNFPAFL